ncbi:MAG: hypothetical protein LQ343_006166 [Gyalolechia ehrenbergii]|nr:MAG: hypothetical protein LQ343_006166 [Gyalolechia ehrenbergii]
MPSKKLRSKDRGAVPEKRRLEGRPRKAEGRLPPIEGPKLHQFVDFDGDLEFVQLLTDPESDASAHVFEVVIASKTYALKIFKYYDAEEANDILWGPQRDRAPLDQLDYYLDPFYNECRAYGRLVDTKLNGEVAVQCHGYLILPFRFQAKLEEEFGVNGWDQPSDLPLRAIVKDFVPEDTTWSPRVVGKILKDLKRMREHKIYAMDIKPENYKEGLLVDFSISITKPHFIFEIKPQHQVEGYKNQDLIAFDVMIQEQRVKTRRRAFPNMETKEKLRSYGKPVVEEEEDDEDM